VIARHIRVKYTLCNGSRGTLDVIAASTCDGIDIALELFGDRLRTCSARPA
jgi:hypothetical protein